MEIVYLVVTAVTVAANASMAVGDLVGARAVVDNAASVGVRPRWIPALGGLKLAGACGLLVGLVGVLADRPLWQGIGTAAAIGLVAFFTGALVAHVRARRYRTMYFPGMFWVLAAGSLVLALAVG